VNIFARNGREALHQVAGAVLRYGDEVSPRGKRTLEVRGLEVQIVRPGDAFMPGMNANFGARVVACEALQLIGGFSDPKFSVRMVPALADFVNPSTGSFDGAYGPRIWRTLPATVRRLAADHDTRQAVLSIWGDEDALREESLDFPCTTTLHFLIRRDRLELDVAMRSNDVDKGFKHDVGQFTQLQLSVAGLLGLEAGPYRHRAASMHLYEGSWEWAEGLSGDNLRVPVPDHPRGISGRDCGDMMSRAIRIARGKPLEDETPSERWYREQVERAG
jgi:thymidylate synthase